MGSRVDGEDRKRGHETSESGKEDVKTRARARCADQFDVNQSIVSQVNRLPLSWAARDSLPNAIHDLYYYVLFPPEKCRSAASRLSSTFNLRET